PEQTSAGKFDELTMKLPSRRMPPPPVRKMSWWGWPILGCVLSGFYLLDLIGQPQDLRPFLATRPGKVRSTGLEHITAIKLFARDQGTRRCDSLPGSDRRRAVCAPGSDWHCG